MANRLSVLFGKILSNSNINIPIWENPLTSCGVSAIMGTNQSQIRIGDMEFMIQRKEYLNRLIAWKDEQVIKVVTGIRRCGKSTLLDLYKEYLSTCGANSEQIVTVNFEELENEWLLDYKVLYDYLVKKLQKGKMTYIFLDEIQKVDDFEKVVDSLYVKKNVDIYITGSNSYLLSSELSTLLSGRYVEIKMLPFSFKEYLLSNDSADKELLFAEYLKNGSFPYVATMSGTDEKVNAYLEGIYNTVIVKDIEERQNRKEKEVGKRKITDIALLKNISKYLASIIGSPVSIKGIADYIVSSGRKVSQNTVDDYIEALTEAFVFYSVDRFDISGKQLLKQNGKYYIVDLGLRRYLLQKRNYDLGFSIENVVYLELLRRGYTVNIGKVGNREVDFVAKLGDNTEYIQVSASLTEQSTFDREMASLRAIKDNYPKTILTLDKFTLGNYEGIEVKNVIDWLLD